MRRRPRKNSPKPRTRELAGVILSEHSTLEFLTGQLAMKGVDRERLLQILENRKARL
jgi:hypothetical protein